MLRDSFAAPVCKLFVDENGTETKREIVAGPGAKDVVDWGMITNARTFHPPFMTNLEKWSAANEITIGRGGLVKGELTYQKIAGGKGGQAVKVSGTLTDSNFKPFPGEVIRVSCVVNGEQTYDVTQLDWISGKLVVDVSIETVGAGGELADRSKGTINLSLDRVVNTK